MTFFEYKFVARVVMVYIFFARFASKCIQFYTYWHQVVEYEQWKTLKQRGLMLNFVIQAVLTLRRSAYTYYKLFLFVGQKFVYKCKMSHQYFSLIYKIKQRLKEPNMLIDVKKKLVF